MEKIASQRTKLTIDEHYEKDPINLMGKIGNVEDKKETSRQCKITL